MSASPSLGVDSTLLNFDLLPDSAYVPVDALASLLGVSIATIRRRIAEGKLSPPHGILGLQRYNVGVIRNEILKSFDFITFDDSKGGFDTPLTDANYAQEVAHDD